MMKKNLWYLFATLITLVLLLAACGTESSAPANSPAENTAPDPVEQPAEENPAAPEPTQAEAAPRGNLQHHPGCLPVQRCDERGGIPVSPVRFR